MKTNFMNFSLDQPTWIQRTRGNLTPADKTVLLYLRLDLLVEIIGLYGWLYLTMDTMNLDNM